VHTPSSTHVYNDLWVEFMGERDVDLCIRMCTCTRVAHHHHSSTYVYDDLWVGGRGGRQGSCFQAARLAFACTTESRDSQVLEGEGDLVCGHVRVLAPHCIETGKRQECEGTD